MPAPLPMQGGIPRAGSGVEAVFGEAARLVDEAKRDETGLRDNGRGGHTKVVFAPSPRLLVFSLCALAAFAAAAPSTAAAQPSVRDRLEAMENARPATVPEGAVLSVRHMLDTADRIEANHAERAPEWRRRATRYLERMEAGQDPFPLAKGEIVNRGYRSPISNVLQGYAIYLPPDYDPTRAYPVYIALHGGSSNGNLFLGVVLGNNMDWLTYDEHVYDEYTPRWTPDWIVVAPTGFGQIMWRWMGEQDVLDVLDDVERHYNVDENQVVLGGLSNGGVGAYAIGSRHSWRFATVQAMAGAPSWLQYTGGGLREVTTNEVRRYSGLHLAENVVNTTFRYYHGTEDGGPMRPAYVRAYTQALSRLEGVTAHETWFDAGHDILYRVHRHGRVYSSLADTRRDPRPREVRVVSGDYRAARQHWVSIERLETFPELGRVRAVVGDDGNVTIESSGVTSLSLHIATMPAGENTRITVDGDVVYEGPREALGTRFHVTKNGSDWRAGFAPTDGLRKVAGLSGPISDAYYGRMIHVYGTQNEDDTDKLRRAAERGARGWPLWAWDLRQTVVADTELTDEMMHDAHVVLYATPGSNSVLARVAGALPIKLEEDAIMVGTERFGGRDVGVRFVYPNPLAPHRYMIVQGAMTADDVSRGNKLPEFLPDYAVYDGRELRSQQRRVAGRSRLRTAGNFDDRWRLPGEPQPTAEGSGPDDEEETVPGLPVPPAPAVPAAPTTFLAPDSDQAGHAARRIAALVPGFVNYRATIGGAEWRNVEEARWSVRPAEECYEALRSADIAARPSRELTSLVPAPVEITGPINGIWFRQTHEERPFVIACELALRLPALTQILAGHNIRGVEILSTFRTYPSTSFHRMGLALDLSRFWTDGGWLDVAADYEATPMRRTCAGDAPSGGAGVLRDIACEFAESNLFSSVLTPNYNEGHRDHFHLDTRPNDPRLFLR
ncbi:MAG: extensin family protein [Polyangiales bacterium]